MLRSWSTTNKNEPWRGLEDCWESGEKTNQRGDIFLCVQSKAESFPTREDCDSWAVFGGAKSKWKRGYLQDSISTGNHWWMKPGWSNTLAKKEGSQIFIVSGVSCLSGERRMILDAIQPF